MVKIYFLNVDDYSLDFYETIYNSLPVDRKERADKHVNLNDKKLSVFSYHLLKNVLFLEDINIEEHMISYGENGKPYIKDINLYFSYSHSKNIVAVAVSDASVGVDVEVRKQRNFKSLMKVLHQEEISYLNNFSDDKVVDEFLMVWTSKEAYLKYTGTGLSVPLNSFNIFEFSNNLYTFKPYEDTTISCFATKISEVEVIHYQ